MTVTPSEKCGCSACAWTFDAPDISDTANGLTLEAAMERYLKQRADSFAEHDCADFPRKNDS